MNDSLRPARWLSTSTPLLALIPLAAAAKDHFLTIGGGYSPHGNQVSLEKNVLFFQSLLAERFAEGVEHDILFGDGANPQPDLQFHDANAAFPRANELIAQVFQATKNWGHQYRSHSINAAEASSLANVRAWFDAAGSRLKPGDRLFIYATAHGAKADKKQPHNTSLLLWNNERLPMSEMAGLLNKIDPEVAVVVVMVQCYSGGFAHLLFNEGDPQKGCSPAHRCGFFATVNDRVAAGCTSDIAEENYQEYSSYFWAAIRGQTRTGQVVPTPDYDGDARVTFEESHAFALLNSPTIDISIKTSDVFLRQFSKQGDSSAKVEPPAPENPGELPPAALLSSDAPYSQLVQAASSVDRAVMEGLSLELGLSGEERARQARELAEKTSQENKQMGGRVNQKSGELSGACQSIRRDVLNRWPDLENAWNPRVQDILSREANDVTAFIESHANYGKMIALRGEVDGLNEQKLDLDRRWAKCQRLLRALENVALAHNLPLVATPELVQRYEQLLAAERGVFPPPIPTVAAAPIDDE
jgi:hypothetical protein